MHHLNIFYLLGAFAYAAEAPAANNTTSPVHQNTAIDHAAHACPNRSYDRQCGRDWDYTSYPTNQQDRADAVVEMFRHAWDGYRQFAYPHDDLLPRSNSYSDSRNGWGLTMINSLDTAIIMGQQDIVDIILHFIPTVDFTKNNSPDSADTSLFETTIRYLGGLLSSYDLLKGPFAHMVTDEKKVDVLLSQAVRLADTLKFAFSTTTGLPVNGLYIDMQTSTFDSLLENGDSASGLAELGTLVLEWQHLSDLTGDPLYGDLAQKAEAYWFKNVTEIFPGLTGSKFSVENGSTIDDAGGWTSGSDSAYEYLIKMYVYDPERYGNYSEQWRKAADSTIEHLLSSPSSRPDLVMAGRYRGKIVRPETDYLACFIGGNFLLGSTALNEPKYREYGLKFSEFCANGYRHTSSGIGPSRSSWNNTELDSDPSLADQTEHYKHAGFFIPTGHLDGGQTPEAVESWYYAYQTTRDQYWRDVAWAYAIAQNKTERLPVGFGSLQNVLAEDGGGTDDFMPSFMLAETLKYQFLIQSPKEGVWNVQQGENKTNFFVYNTEAHPFRVAAKHPV
ncbi:unnamed protein product [Zymoseptoria tritici ST99CH_3D1]|uniref:alpha-1,2-Mannosidase n=1 Tax=Zymoseptoria tritici (strain ST99CH_3D7) TaxID=1276538 RepID=A0A1X7S2S7_ZYMT9|nr:unnamed protein product [Zymoseptoria tritici ST99CH_3D7]SMR61391.1 unnamed protein product [Zymoseptoria tritici ST99CH_3D1]